MAHFIATMISASHDFTTDLLARKGNLIFTARNLSIIIQNYLFLIFPAIAGNYHSFNIAFRTWSRMAIHWTWMLAILSSFLSTRMATSVRDNVTIIFGVFLLSTKTVVFWHLFRAEEVTFWTAPVVDHLVHC
jgi:hypothetical protein